MKNEFAVADANEMHAILKTSACTKRYQEISHQLMSELLVAIATKGEVVGGNNRGSDVVSPEYGKIEVKSRILGTDTAFPRVSLRRSNIEKADWFVGIRWTREFDFHAAYMLPKVEAIKLYDERKQENSGLAHINWEKWKSAPGAIDLSAAVRTVLNSEGLTA